MSAMIRTPECYPEVNSDRLFLGGFVADPQHDKCPGGHHIAGVIGGWDCPCPCHRKVTTDPPFPPHNPDYPDVNPATGDERETTTGPATDPAWDGPDDDEPTAA